LVSAVCLTHDGRRAVSGSYDNTLKIWDMETGRLMAVFRGDGPISAVAVASDGRTIVTGEASGRVHLLRLENFGA
jgi:WD40 repeat protein